MDGQINPQFKSWLDVKPNSDFPIQNIPFGIASANEGPFVATIIGDTIINLAAMAEMDFFKDLNIDHAVFSEPALNDFIELGRPVTRSVRARIAKLFELGNAHLKEDEDFGNRVLFKEEEVALHIPLFIQDYTDFYSSKEHATNIGTMFRDANNPLLPNWRHIPVGYHGRASSILVSGTPIVRPRGQQRPAAEGEGPQFGPSKRLDFELEMAFAIGKENELGEPISIENAEEHIFGMVIFNDWSARDIQVWEYVPLGPFLGKSFASSISPWVVTLDALEPFRTPTPEPELPILPYLKYEGKGNFDINLEVAIQPDGSTEKVVCNSNTKFLYWNMAQQLTHHTVNGCNMQVGDMCASGTISGQDPNSYGSMLEISWGGSKSVEMNDGTERKFIHDGDTVIMRAWAQKDSLRIGFGAVASKVLPNKA